MTARVESRRRSTQVAAAVAAVLGVIAIVAVGVAVYTLRTSEEGEAVELDLRPVVQFPATPNAAVAVVDDAGRLTSLVVVTLDPSGTGGSMLTVPTNADTTSGFGAERLPLGRQVFTPNDPASVESLIAALEPLLTITIEHGVVLGPDELAERLEPHAPLRVELPETVVDSDLPGTGVVTAAGVRSLDLDRLVAAFTAIDVEGSAYDHHATDVALWSAVVDALNLEPDDVEVPLDEFDRPIPPADADELLDRLVGSNVALRDVAIDPASTATADNPTDADFVVLDRRDALLVFGEISPGLVSTPNPSLSFHLGAGYSEDQIALLGEDATTAALIRTFIGELLFSQANVVSVQTSPVSTGAPATTVLEVADEAFLEGVEEVAPVLFGDAEVVVADRLIDGVDVAVTFGTDFLDVRAELAAAEEAEADDEADFDVSADGSAGGAEDGESTSSTAASGDTVADNE